MVIRNATLRMNGQEIGDWNEQVDPGQVRKEVVDLFEASLPHPQNVMGDKVL